MSDGGSSVLVAGARTPIGRLNGALSGLSAVQLGGLAISGALARSRVNPNSVEYVVMGHVLQAGAGQITARQAAALGGIPLDVPAVTINKVCLSGLTAIAHADQLIRAGEFECVVAGGMESMSAAPHLLLGSRRGVKYGDWNLKDSMALDALTCAFENVSMGVSTERDNERFAVTRRQQDSIAFASHQRAAAARDAGIFEEEIVPVWGENGQTASPLLAVDEGIRPDTSIDGLSQLRPVFSADGTITAGNSSPISDGAAAVVVMSKKRAEELGIPWIAEIGPYGTVAGPGTTLHDQPARAIERACARGGLDPRDLDLVEINEAFAAVTAVSSDALGIDASRVNVNGGAIALGHPVGMSGARIVLHLSLELQRRGGGMGVAALCGGGGQGDALILRVPAAPGV